MNIRTDGTNTLTINETQYNQFHLNQKEYEEDLARRQREHLDRVYNNQNLAWRPCLHDACTQCLGTGVKKDGSIRTVGLYSIGSKKLK